MGQSIMPVLQQVSLINKKYDDIAKITGEHFNIFKILKIETSEVKTHSAFLAELMNAKGSHGCKNLFLDLFINQQTEKHKDSSGFCDRLKSFVTSKSKATIESHIGFKNEDETEGGRIDILLKATDGNTIIIENKIYAGDQHNQLIRYNNAYPEAPIFYLTLYGITASEYAKGILSEGNEYVCISYKVDVINWLEACKEKAASLPILRETISQYIYLVKHLTNQTINNKMNEEIVSTLISNGNNIASAIEITNSLDDAKRRLLMKFAQKLEAKVIQIAPDISIEISNDFGNKHNGINFKVPDLEKEYVTLSFASDLNEYYFEIVNLNNNGSENKDINNLIYYREKLKEVNNVWGKVENVEKGWHGDWVCRYYKLDAFFREPKNWADLADDNIADILNDVSKDAFELINALKQKANNTNNKCLSAATSPATSLS